MGFGGLDDEFHHDQRSDRDDLVKVRTLHNLLFQWGGEMCIRDRSSVAGVQMRPVGAMPARASGSALRIASAARQWA